MNTLEKVRQTIADQLRLNIDEVSAEATMESLNIDSLDMVEVISSLEGEYDITIDDTEVFESISEIVAYIESRK